MTRRQRIAVIGTGISGLTCAWFLARQHEVQLFEANDYAGGHTHTVPVRSGGRTWPVNTGFIVFNDWTYPNFIRLMELLGVESQVSDMSFSVQSAQNGLEYNGTDLNGLFAQRRNLFNPRFLGMVREILRFNALARRELADDHIDRNETLAGYLARHRFSRYFRNHYIIPMGAAIWSAPEVVMEQFPVHFFLRFFNNHGMLSVDERPTWRVLKGGSVSYVSRMLPSFGDNLHLNMPVAAVRRCSDSVTVLAGGSNHRFDQVIFACHSDQALALLEDATAAEQSVLGALPYQGNDVVLHTDSRLLPRSRRAWAAWNYHVPAEADQPVSVTYNMNILQNLDAAETFCVTLNRSDVIAPDRVLGRYRYSHPVFTLEGMQAQAEHGRISGRNRTHFCGAYWFNGFHEDGVVSALRVLEALQADCELIQPSGPPTVLSEKRPHVPA